MAIAEELQSMLTVSDVFRAIVWVVHQHFFNTHPSPLLWTYPVWIPLTPQVEILIAELSPREVDLLGEILETAGLAQNKELKLEEDNSHWIITINPAPPEFDPNRDDDDDTSPLAEYQERPIAKAMSAAA
jgi:hypothetical protein